MSVIPRNPRDFFLWSTQRISHGAYFRFSSPSAVDSIDVKERGVREVAGQDGAGCAGFCGRASWFGGFAITGLALSPPKQLLNPHVSDGSNANSFISSQGGYILTGVTRRLIFNLQSTFLQQ